MSLTGIICNHISSCLNKLYNNQKIYTMLIDNDCLEIESNIDSKEYYDKMTLLSNYSLNALNELKKSMKKIMNNKYDLHLIKLQNFYYESINEDPNKEKQFSQYYQLKKSIEKGLIRDYLGKKQAILTYYKGNLIIIYNEGIERQTAKGILDIVTSSFNNPRMINEEVFKPKEEFRFCSYFATNDYKDEFRPSIIYETNNTSVVFGQINPDVYATFFTST